MKQDTRSPRPARSGQFVSALAVLLLVLQGFSADAAKAKSGKGKPIAEENAAEDAPPVDPQLFQALAWRHVGPFRGGRSTAVAGVDGDPLTYYFGATGGGVWKTTDAGNTWRNVSDGHLATGSVGAVAVAPSDPNVVYVGMGEAQIRGVTSSHGDGIYRSTDAGATWAHLGLTETRQVSRIRIHPDNPDVAWVAAQGSPWKNSPERGIYKTIDGGANWEKVLFVNETTGASDLALDATNPRVLYAAFWDHRRHPWEVRSGGPGSSIWKTVDGGVTWEKLESGLPQIMGKIGVAVSPVKPNRVWAIVEAEEGGLFRSDDGGAKWQRVNAERVLRARAWYYTKVFADTQDAETVYVLNAPVMRSIDGGMTFKPVPVPHGDTHDLWIAPDDNRRMINSNDGGANVSWNAGATWSRQDTLPTVQFYRVYVDDQDPYFLYGGQQDNSTVAIASRSYGPGIGREDWYIFGGCESAHVAVDDPKKPRYIYAGCFQGLIDEYDRETETLRDVMAYPNLGLGSIPKDQKYRFNWNAPILTSMHDRSVIYHAGNILLRSRDRGHSWDEISPDLTRNEVEKQGPGGGPITREGAGGEVYNTILYVAESPHEAGTLWVGSDDGLVHLTRDSGENWTNVTPPGLPESQINAIEVSPHDSASAWIAVSLYKFGDFTPHLYKTEDYGATWTRRVEGIGEEAWTRVVREDPGRAGLLYAGTETGLYVSFDDGTRWQPFELGMPVVPITDLAIRQNDLVAATQGRGFWILDDLTPLHHLELNGEDTDGEEDAGDGLWLLPMNDTIRDAWFSGNPPPGRGKNPPSGVLLHYILSEDVAALLAPPEPNSENGEQGGKANGKKEAGEEDGEGEDEGDAEDADGEDEEPPKLELQILNADGVAVATYPVPGREAGGGGGNPFSGGGPPKLTTKTGLNRFAWNMRVDPPSRIKGIFSGFTEIPGHMVAPGTYTAVLTLGEHRAEQSFAVLPDPRHDHAPEAYAESERFSAKILERADAIFDALNRLRSVRGQVQGWIERTEDHAASEEIKEMGESLVEAIDAWEKELVDTRQETFQDVINFPNQLAAQLAFLLVQFDGAQPPIPEGAHQRFADLDEQWQEHQAEGERLLAEDVAAFNALIVERSVPAVVVPEDDEDTE